MARKALEQAAARPGARRAGPAGWPRRAICWPTWPPISPAIVDTLDAEPGRLEWIAARRSALAGLTRKYGTTIDEVLAGAAESAVRLTALEASDDRIELLAARVAELDGQLGELAAAITGRPDGRRGAFADQVVAELAALAMPHARLAFQLTPAALGPHGADQIELLFSANPGSEPRSLGKVASGGELSRVRLALEVVLAAGQEAGTLVFDEVDAGVGGRVAVEIGRRLARLAQASQVSWSPTWPRSRPSPTGTTW